MATKNYHGPSLGLGSFFGNSSSDDEKVEGEEETTEDLLAKEGDIRDYELIPGNEEFASWMLSKSETLKSKRILELACGTGILSIFMKKQGWDVTSSDYNDGVIDRNMTFNVTLNGLEETSIPHLPYTWGEPFPDSAGTFDVVMANDILIYQTTYALLADSIKQILSRHKHAALPPEDSNAPRFILGHKRRVKATPSFFDVVTSAGLHWRKIANYIYEITLIKAQTTE